MQELNLLFCDHHLLVVNKPAGIVTHPTYRHGDDTFWDVICAWNEQYAEPDWDMPPMPDRPDWAYIPEPMRSMIRAQFLERYAAERELLPTPCLLHRLDKETSGVILLARTLYARKHLAQQFIRHTLQKTYLAVVHHEDIDWVRADAACSVHNILSGQKIALPVETLCPGMKIHIDAPLQRDTYDRRRSVIDAEGLSSRTICEVLAVQDTCALLKVFPITGKTHQIRVHLAAIGWPVAGDAVYTQTGTRWQGRSQLERQWLHAWQLTVQPLPKAEVQTFVASVPQELQDWLDIHISD